MHGDSLSFDTQGESQKNKGRQWPLWQHDLVTFTWLWLNGTNKNSFGGVYLKGGAEGVWEVELPQVCLTWAGPRCPSRGWSAEGCWGPALESDPERVSMWTVSLSHRRAAAPGSSGKAWYMTGRIIRFHRFPLPAPIDTLVYAQGWETQLWENC